MEFDAEELHALSALFTLALHLTQVDAGIADGTAIESNGSAWGQPQEDELPEDAVKEEAGKADVAAAEWAAFWGWDCCGPNGLLEQLFTALGIPRRSWLGLKCLPEIGGTSSAQRRRYLQLVSSYIRVLDKDLPTLHMASEERQGTTGAADLDKDVHCVDDAAMLAGQPDADALIRRESGGSDATPTAAPRGLPDDFFEGITSDSDSDLEQDLASVHLQRRLLQRNSQSSNGRASLLDPAAQPLLQVHVSQSASTASPASSPMASLPAVSTFREAAGSDGEGSEVGSRLPQLPGYPPASAAKLREPKRSFSKAEALAKALERWQVAGSADNAEPDTTVPGSEQAAEESTRTAAEADPSKHLVLQQETHGEQAAEARLPMQQSSSLGSLSDAQISGKALTALWVLLEACIQSPGGQGSAQSSSGEQGDTPPDDGSLQPEPGRATVGGVPAVKRWYDSRARVTLKTVAAWLRVPWRKVTNFECLLVYQLMLPSEDKGRAPATPWEHSLRAAKIGAAALGIGALFAVTGGIAAPAIAAGVGAAIGLAGGSAAVATGVSGFLATTAGGAVVASAVGAAGGGLAAPHVARRIGLVKEFGFWALDAEMADMGDSPAASSPRSVSVSASERVEEHQPSEPAELTRPTRQQSSPPRRWDPFGQSRARGRGDGAAEMEMMELSAAAKPVAGSASTYYDSSAGSAHASEGAPQPGADTGHIMLAASNAASAGVPKDSSKASPKLDQLIESKEDRGTPPGRKQAPEAKEAPRTHWSWRKPSPSEPLLPAPVSPGRKVQDMRMSLTIGVCGWISKRQDFGSQWMDLAACQRSSEVFTLVWESKELIELNLAIVNFAASQAGQEAAKWVIQHFFFTGLVAALAWPALIYSAIQLIDTAWSVALHRAQQAGRLLAHVLAAGAHGDRPVTLVGNSMGARLIFHCLLELSRLKAKGIVEHACLLGMPVALKPERWAMARSVVSGRLINGFSRKDWLLAVVYRGANGFIKDAAGLCPAPFPGIENVNLTGLIQGHFEYIERAGEILELIGLCD